MSERGIEYSHPDGVGQLLRRRKVKLKTGRRKASARESRPPRTGSFQKNFADKIRQVGRREPDKPLKVLAFDEARFGLINWHREGATVPEGFVSPTLHIVRRA